MQAETTLVIRAILTKVKMTTITAIEKEIEELKYSILWVHEPVCKVFIIGVDDSPTVEEIKA